MIRNYIKIAFRNLLRYKSFSIINITGLAIGLAASLIIALWVFDELEYDKFHEKEDRIYRVERHIEYEGKIFDVPVVGAVYGETLIRDIPGIVDFTRVYPIELSVINHLNSSQEERILFVDKGFFNVFTFPLLEGDPKTALAEPFTVVLSRKAAMTYFGEEFPLGKSLEVEWGDERKQFKVTGIVDDVPEQSHFHFDVLASFATTEELLDKEQLKTWLSNYLYTYVLLHPDATPESLQPKLRGVVEEYIAPAYLAFLSNKEDEFDIHSMFVIILRPLDEIHLNARLMWEIEPQGNITSVYIFSIVSILILAMACFNFMNLSTALGSKRSREVGIRKTTGATRGQLIQQFLSETVVIAVISFALALIIIEVTLPAFNTFTGKMLSLSSFMEPKYMLVLLALIIGTGILAGLYPAFYLSKFNPMIVLRKNEETRTSGISFRQILVVLQFSISILLIIGTIIAFLQLRYFYDRPVGYKQENLMVISTESSKVRNNMQVLRDQLAQNPKVTSVTTSGSVPAARDFSDMGFRSELSEDVFVSIYITVGYDFFETYGMEFLAGRPYSREYGTDTAYKFIVNEQVVKKIGLNDPEEAIGMKYGHFDNEGNMVNGEIIGVVKDFHFKPLDKAIEPITFRLTDDWLEYITIRYNTADVQTLVTEIGDTWRDIFPNEEYAYFFLKEHYDSLYIEESRMKNILLIFTFLAIFIGCLGLFGLAAFVAQQKSKEIGIRKVHGATVSNIVVLLTRQFSYWVIMANLIAWPLAYYFMDDWLSNFYYRIGMPYWVFLAAGLIALLLALFTVSYRAYRAASSDPLDAIKYE